MKREAPGAAPRMRLLPLRLRLSHLRALIRREPAGSVRARKLAALLQEQLAVAAAKENRVQ
jgi:hypothetical protein